MKKKLTAGDTVWLVWNERRRGAPQESVVSKVSRKWVYIYNGYCRFDVDTWRVDGGGYSIPATIYESKEAWEKKESLETHGADLPKTCATNTEPSRAAQPKKPLNKPQNCWASGVRKMTDYNDLITRLRSMDGIGDIQLNELMNRKTPMVAADAIAELVSRVAYLESRLEISPEHDIDGIAARDATIHYQDEYISELKFRLAEANKALRVRLGSELERANELVADLQAECSELRGMAGAMDIFRSEMIDSGVIDINVPPMFFSESIIPRLLRLADMEKQEPVAWCIDGEDGREYNGTPKMSDGRIGTPLYAAPPVITQHEPVTTVEDRYNADGKSCHITNDLPAGMPLYAAPPVAAPVRLTDDQAEKVDEAIREALGDAYDCLRVWNAWSYGTMGPDDFSQVAEDSDRVAEIRNAAAVALGFKVDE